MKFAGGFPFIHPATAPAPNPITKWIDRNFARPFIFFRGGFNNLIHLIPNFWRNNWLTFYLSPFFFRLTNVTARIQSAIGQTPPPSSQ